MYKQIIIFILIIFFSANAHSGSQKDIETAISFVEKTRMGDNLHNLAYESILRTMTYRMIVKDLGPQKASKLMKAELATSIKNYQQEWNKNLAITYLEFFTLDELESLLVKKHHSPYFQRMINKQKEIGDSMKKKSEHILADVGKESLLSAFTKTFDEENS